MVMCLRHLLQLFLGCSETEYDDIAIVMAKRKNEAEIDG